MTTEKVIWCRQKHAVLHNFLATANNMALLLQWGSTMMCSSYLVTIMY